MVMEKKSQTPVTTATVRVKNKLQKKYPSQFQKVLTMELVLD